MVIKRVGVLSVGKIMGILQGAIGLIIGCFFALFGILGGAMGAMGGDASGGMAGMLFGGAAIILFPVFYAAIGFIGGIIATAIYNLVAGIVGGIEVVIE